VEQAQRLADLKRKIIKTGVSVREELILSPSGSQRWFDAIYQPLYDQAHQIVGILCYARDITERVHAEEKIRSLASQLTVAEQEERQRISQVLHDDLQQRLFALKAQLSLLNSVHWKDQLSPGVHFDLDEIQASLSEAINVTRNLSIDLSPVVLKGGDLIESMTWLASRMLNQHGLQVDLELNGNFDRLDDNLRMFLFQSVSELLFNVVKHAGMLKAKVTLDQDDQHAYITIRDGGKGFDVKEVMSNSKMAHGLLIVQDRLSLMGCKMEITSEPGKGTKVVIKVPIETS
jgi:signal transduction histidine kinase